MRYALSTAGLTRIRAFLSRDTLLAFDIDGTLAPIVDRPWDARVPGDVQRALKSLASHASVAIVTGRAVEDARPMLGFAPRYLIGNHGAEGVPGQERVSEQCARVCRAWLDELASGTEPWRDVDGIVVVGPSTSRIVVAGAAGDTSTTLIESVFGAALSARGQQVPVEVVHPFASGDAHGLILFFLVLATLISTLVVQAVLLARAARARVALWLGVNAAWAVLAGAVGVAAATWIAGGYDTAALVPMGGLVALTALAAGTFVAGFARLLGAAGLGLSALVIILLDLISSGGPAGSTILPDVYRWMSPWMPAGQLNSALRGTLYFGGEGVALPVLVISAWLALGLVLVIIGGYVRRPAAEPEVAPAA